MSEWKLITAKRISVCEVCARKVPVGSPIYWSRARSVIRCESDKPIDATGTDGAVVGVAGGSARRQYKSKAEWDEDTVISRFPKMGRFLNLLNDDQTSLYDVTNLTDPTSNIVDGVTKGLYSQYKATISIYGLDEYNKRVVEFKYIDAFPTNLGSIAYSYKDSGELESSLTLSYSQLIVTPISEIESL